MKEQRKQIKESFFNPVFHLFPLLLFLIIDDFSGMNLAWKITFPVALMMVLYVYYFYNRIFNWHIIFTFVFLSIGLIAGSEMLFAMPPVVKHLIFEIVVFFYLLIFLLFRRQIQRLISGYISKLIPMTNNFEEMYRFVWMLFLVMLVFISIHLGLNFIPTENTEAYLRMLQYAYVSVLIFLIIYENLRVRIVRAKLLKEEWWPIVSEQGKIVGSIEHLTCLSDENKYIHPVIRVMLIDKGMVLLQKRTNDDIIHSGMWDTAISNHVRVGENIEQCVDRTAKERYSLEALKYMHLSNYTLEVSNEFHYAFLFVSCQLIKLLPNLQFVNRTKWWTQQQIEDNLSSGIFTENFLIEYDLLKRTGLLETGKCECICRLKETIYKQARNN